MKIVDDNNRSEYQPKPEDRNDDKPKKMNFFIQYAVMDFLIQMFFYLKEGRIDEEGMAIVSILVFIPMSLCWYQQKLVDFTKMISPKYFLYVLIPGVSIITWHFTFGERTYADCILNHVKSTGEYYAVQKIETACHAKHR